MNKYRQAIKKLKSGDTSSEVIKELECLLYEYEDISAMFGNLKKMHEQSIEDAKFLKEVVEPNLKVLKETYRCKPVTILETPDRLEDNLVGNVICDGEPITDFKKEIDVQNHTIDKYEQDILDYEKALDKACEILEPKMKCLTGRTKEQWKEWLLGNE